MDIQSVLSVLGLGTMGGKMAWLIGILIAIYKWYIKNKDRIHAIILRIEKEKTDELGWTNEEKEQLVVDIFFKEVYPILPAWIRLIPFRKSIIEKLIRNIVKKICGKAKEVKEAVKIAIAKS